MNNNPYTNIHITELPGCIEDLLTIAKVANSTTMPAVKSTVFLEQVSQLMKALAEKVDEVVDLRRDREREEREEAEEVDPYETAVDDTILSEILNGGNPADIPF